MRLRFTKCRVRSFPALFVIAHKSHSFMHHRNLLYTAVTRAKESVILLGGPVGHRQLCRQAPGGLPKHIPLLPAPAGDTTVTAPPVDVHTYYRQVTDVDIGEIARELIGDRITQESRQTLFCDCPNHRSQSHRSLHVWLDKQGWFCHACATGGGRVAVGRVRPVRRRHPRAVWLHAGFPPAGARLPGLTRSTAAVVEARFRKPGRGRGSSPAYASGA